MRFQGKVALVTGGAKGIGRSIVEGFAREGAKVAIVDCDHDAGVELAGKLRREGHEVLFCRCNVDCQEDVTAALESIVKAFGTVDLLVNDAAVQLNKPLLETTTDEFEKVMSVNMTGTFMFTRDVAKLMIAQKKGGAIVNFSSTFAVVGSPGYAAYHASKGAIASFSRAAAIALMPYGIRVNSVAPGTTMTPGLIDGARGTGDEQKGLESFLALQPLKRFGTPEEIAAVVLMLASDEASFVYGAQWLADGGYTIL